MQLKSLKIVLCVLQFSIEFSSFVTANNLTQNVSKRTAVLDRENGFEVIWIIDKVKNLITFEVTANTTGYVGFGISSGGMKGADIVIGGVDSEGKSYFQDRYGIGNLEPVIDIQQDWSLLDAKEADGVTHLKFSRSITTCDDKQDVAIKDETQRLIWALGESDTIDYHGSRSRGAYSVNLLDPPPYSVDLKEFKSINLISTAVLPDNSDSIYWCSVIKGPEILENESPHIIAMGPKLDNDLAIRHTHHLTLHSCEPPPNVDTDTHFAKFHDGDCFSGKSEADRGERKFDAYADCRTMLYSWAIGGKTMIFPENVGLSISTNNGKRRQYFLLELHLDNPGSVSGISFQTGVQLFYSDQPRPIEAAALVFSVAADFRLTIPPNSENFKVVSHCGAECTKFLPEDGYTLFNLQFHAHNTANKMRVRHFREGTELPYIGDDQNYDNGFQDNRNIKEVKVLPGDHLTVECTYDTTKLQPPRVVHGGYTTRDEMCDATFYYYPKGRLLMCTSVVTSSKILDAVGLQEVEGVRPTNPKITLPEEFKGITYTEYLKDHVNWTQDLRFKMQSIAAEIPQSLECVVEDAGDFVPVIMNNLTELVNYPIIEKAYIPPPPNSNCPGVQITNSSGNTQNGNNIKKLFTGLIILYICHMF